MNIVDALVVTLGLDASGFKKGQKEAEAALDKTKEAANKNAKEIEKSSSLAADSIKKIRNEVLGLAAAFLSVSAIKGFVETVTRSDAALGRMAQNVGMSVADLSAWEGAAKRAGGSAEGMAASIKGIVAQYEQWKLTGNPASMAPALRALGIDAADRTTGKLRDLNDILLDLSDKMKGMSGPEAQSIGSMLGLDEGTVNLLRMGRKEVVALLEWQKKNNALSEEDTRLAAERQVAWLNLTEKLQAFGRTILNDVSPILTKLVQTFTDWLTDRNSDRVKQLTGYVQQFADYINSIDWSAVRKGLSGFADDIHTIASAIGTAVEGTKTFFGYWSGKSATGNAIVDQSGGVGGTVSTMWTGAKALFGDKAARAQINAMGDQVNARINQRIRGIRNNNPGNLEFAGQAGAVREDGEGRFAKFSSMEQGIAALANQLQLYQSRGIDTISKIMDKYAPPGENKTGAYKSFLSSQTGFGVDKKLDFNDTDTLRSMLKGLIAKEVGPGNVSMDQINAGLSLRADSRYGGSGKVVNNDVRIGQITVQTQATDPKGIAMDIGPAVSNYSFSAQAGMGFN